MDEVEWWEFDTPAEMAEQVADDVAFVIESAIEAHGGARVAFPGGRSLDVVYEALCKKEIDWAKVIVIPTDERLVPIDDERSNRGRLIGYFGKTGADIVPLVDEAAIGDYREAGRVADARLAELDWPLDLALLNVAADGHTASIFRGPDLDRAVAGPRERRAVGVRPDPMPDHAAVDRVTLTAAALSSARAVMVAVTGDDKRALLERSIQEGPLSSTPIGRVMAEIDASVDIFWSPA